jgi:hypothetical protein
MELVSLCRPAFLPARKKWCLGKKNMLKIALMLGQSALQMIALAGVRVWGRSANGRPLNAAQKATRWPQPVNRSWP